MKKYLKTILGVVLSAMLLFAFAGCGGSNDAAQTPGDEAVAALDTMLSALKSADMEALQELAGEEDIFGEAEDSLGSEENKQAILSAMFSHFDYKIGTPEEVDEANVNVPVTVTNVDMTKAVESWFSDLMAYAIAHPEIASDETQLMDKTVGLLKEAVDKTSEAEDGLMTSDVTIPMVKEDGQWDVSEDVDDGVIDAMLGGFASAVSNLNNGLNGGGE